ncbi:hypothetical protein Tdes44962_MAKER05558 [Teratosphaeria destructans]|uniref:Uncharacterized protein n=1 Tax=Teratosphaeria destructans TaxID=418781 RepID=A0A9W7VYI1_9PEZI|nr:hypothetical protein Tdes44962_MAKER05558 [Teratosphaeria destructans]
MVEVSAQAEKRAGAVIERKKDEAAEMMAEHREGGAARSATTDTAPATVNGTLSQHGFHEKIGTAATIVLEGV